MRRRDFDADLRAETQRSGTIPRGALRRQPAPAPARDWLAGMLLVAVAVVVIIGLFGALGGDNTDPTGADPTQSPVDGSPIAALSPSPAPTEAIASPTTAPTVSTTAQPTATATRPPTPPPTPRPTATARPTPTPTPSPTPTATARATARPTAPPDVAAGDLVILEPTDGDVVSDSTIVVRGLAPPGATITRDIPFWFDEHTRADSRGRWSFAVELLPGDNRLTFRIDDDADTAQSLTVRYDGN